MDADAWGEIINGANTFGRIAEILLRQQRSVIIGWTDGRCTHHDVLFTYHPLREGQLQGGLRGGGYLFVRIMRRGAFGFALQENALSPDYVQEKLNVQGETAFATATGALLMRRCSLHIPKS